MTEDPIRPIEAQLKRSAQQRRSQATDPFGLHPAVRGLLHSEVARTYPPSARSAPEARLPWLTWLWPRLAVAAGVAIVVLLAVVQFVHSPDPRSAEFAASRAAKPTTEAGPSTPAISTRDAYYGLALERQESSPVDSADAPPLTPAPASAPQITRSLDEPPPSAVAAAPPHEAPITEPRAVRPSSTPPIVSTDPQLAAPDAFAIEAAQKPTSLAARSVAASPPIDDSPQRDAALLPHSQHFAQVPRDRDNLQSPPLPDVLRSFQFALLNDTVHIVDADGSVYEGTLEPSDQPDTTRFIASGTNRATQHRVVFEGALHHPAQREPEIPGTTAGARTALGFEAPSARRSRATPPAGELAPAPVQILGRATLDDHTRFEVRAFPLETR